MREKMTGVRKYFLMASMLLVLSLTVFCRTEVSAEEAVSPDRLQVNFSKYSKEYTLKNGKAYMRLSYQLPQVDGDSEAARAINDFYEAEKIQWLDSHNKDRKGARRDYKYGTPAWSDQITNCQVTFQDSSYINIYQEGYCYRGGAHGMPYRISHVFSAVTGHQVTAAEILGMTDHQVNAKVREKYTKRYNKTKGKPKCPFYDLENGKWFKRSLKKIDFAGDERYYLEKGKLVFYADPYMLGSYAAGFIEVSLPL